MYKSLTTILDVRLFECFLKALTLSLSHRKQLMDIIKHYGTYISINAKSKTYLKLSILIVIIYITIEQTIKTAQFLQ